MKTDEEISKMLDDLIQALDEKYGDSREICGNCKHFVQDGFSHCSLHHHKAQEQNTCSWFESKDGSDE